MVRAAQLKPIVLETNTQSSGATAGREPMSASKVDPALMSGGVRMG
jgi:hypothetical protein